jgi:hypothetical protein
MPNKRMSVALKAAWARRKRAAEKDPAAAVKLHASLAGLRAYNALPENQRNIARLTGPKNHLWKGDAILDGHDRCRALYPAPLGRCEADGCDREAVDRHHKDGDSKNNDRQNVEFLCRGCHLKADGRAVILVAAMRAAKLGTTEAAETRAKKSAAKKAAWANGIYDELLARRGPDGRWRSRHG